MPTSHARVRRSARRQVTIRIAACVLAAGGMFAGACTATNTQHTNTASVAGTESSIHSSSLLRAATDHEALYTLAGGLKPMSTGIWSSSFRVDEPDLTELRHARAALAPLRNQLWYADIQVFDNIHDGSRSAHAFIVHRAALSRMIERYNEFWSAWGITPCTHPAEIVAVVDRMPRPDRWRAYGYLFGYPAYAVDFFIQASLAAQDGRDVGPGKDRQFIHIPTYAADTGRFTYAVPLDHTQSAADEAIAREAARILAAYTEQRDRMGDARGMIRELERMNRRFKPSAARAAEAASKPEPEAALGGTTDAVLDAR